jgi:hypothetical protein
MVLNATHVLRRRVWRKISRGYAKGGDTCGAATQGNNCTGPSGSGPMSGSMKLPAWTGHWNPVNVCYRNTGDARSCYQTLYCLLTSDGKYLQAMFQLQGLPGAQCDDHNYPWTYWSKPVTEGCSTVYMDGDPSHLRPDCGRCCWPEN